jgi:hypothetical protein
MTLKQSFAHKTVACAVAFIVAAFATEVSAQNTSLGAAKVVRLKGAARYTTGDNKWHPLSEGDMLKSGAVIQTASSSQVDLSLIDDLGQSAQPTQPGSPALSYKPETEARVNLVRLFENTVMAVDKLTALETGADRVTETQLDLRSGRIFGTVKKQTAASRYEVKFPNGVAGVRGTIYTLSSSGVVSVLVGTVIVAYTRADGTVTTQVVKGGQQYDVTTGLISNIPNYDKQEMVKAAKEAGIGPNTPASAFTVNQSIYYVSPTIGFNGAGANSANSGGGNSGP